MAVSSEQTTKEKAAGASIDKASSQASTMANSSGANTATANGKQNISLAKKPHKENTYYFPLH